MSPSRANLALLLAAVAGAAHATVIPQGPPAEVQACIPVDGRYARLAPEGRETLRVFVGALRDNARMRWLLVRSHGTRATGEPELRRRAALVEDVLRGERATLLTQRTEVVRQAVFSGEQRDECPADHVLLHGMPEQDDMSYCGRHRCVVTCQDGACRLVVR